MPGIVKKLEPEAGSAFYDHENSGELTAMNDLTA